MIEVNSEACSHEAWQGKLNGVKAELDSTLSSRNMTAADVRNNAHQNTVAPQRSSLITAYSILASTLRFLFFRFTLFDVSFSPEVPS
jgi:hypothetical protein